MTLVSCSKPKDEADTRVGWCSDLASGNWCNECYCKSGILNHVKGENFSKLICKKGEEPECKITTEGLPEVFPGKVKSL